MVATVTYGLEAIKANFQANTYVAATDLAPDVLGLSNGGYVVASNSEGLNIVNLDFYDANGTPTGSQMASSGAGAVVGAPTLTQMSNGNVVVTWEDNTAGADGLKAAIFTADGEVVREEFSLLGDASNNAPQVAALEGGGFVVVSPWATDSILLQAYDENGDFAFGDLDISLGVGASEPVVTGLADGGLVVSWTVPNGLNHDIVALIFDENGTPQVVNGSLEPFVVGTSGDNTQPAITALPDGNWAVAYSDNGWGDEDVGITLTIMGPNGEVVTPYVHVNTPTANNESDPDITVLDNGFIVVSWTYPASPGVDEDIYCRIFDQDGNPITIGGNSQIVLDNSLGNDVKSAVSGILAGQFVAGWQGGNSDGSGGQITATVKELVRTTTGDNTSETLNGDDIRDIINGNGGEDTLNGFGGNDTLNGGGAADTLNGGDGNDTASYAETAAGVTVSLALAGAQNTVNAGTDTLSGIENLAGSSFADTLSGTSGDNTISGGGGSDNVKGYAGNDVLNGDNGDDTLNGGANDDTLNGGENNDTLIGQDGNDTLAGGNGVDTASYVGAIAGVTVALSVAGAQNTGGDGTDTISGIENLIGSNFADTLSGTSGINTISGGSNNDDLKGYAGDDTLNGDNGNDTLNGGANNDTLNGGENNDTLIGQDGNDALSGGNGVDTASYVGAVAGVTVALSVAGAQNTGGDGFDTLSGIENLIGSNFADTLSGTTGDNTISGGSNNDNVKGYAGDDILNGDNGNDTLNGGANNDTLNGGANDDDLIGQDGSDTFSGGTGSDDFIFDDGHGADTVTDFQNGSDHFDLSAVAGVDEFADLTIIDNGATVTVNYGTGSFTVANLADPAQLDAGDFIFA